MIARQNRRHLRDLPVSLLDQLLENLSAGAQACLNLGKRMQAIGVPNDKISRALQQRQQSDQEEEQPAPEAAELKFQG